MARAKRKRFFSLIFVPDQDREPQSISLSYRKGYILLGVLAFLVIHIIAGTIGYVRLIQVHHDRVALEQENKELKVRNRQIERIAAEFAKIRATEEKIRNAFGVTLGLSKESGLSVDEIEWPAPVSPSVPADHGSQRERIPVAVDHIPSQLFLMTERDRRYYDPENLPTLLPVEGFLTTRFQEGGWYVGRSHLGIDIAAKMGSPIRAAGAGLIVLAAWTPDFGNVVVISHGQGLFSYYAHAMRLMVEQGQLVKRGDPIALLGSSGFSSAPHLHFEIWKDNQPLNPEEFLYALQQPRTETGSS